MTLEKVSKAYTKGFDQTQGDLHFYSVPLSVYSVPFNASWLAVVLVRIRSSKFLIAS